MKITLIENSNSLSLSIINFLSTLGHTIIRFDGDADFVDIMREGKPDLYIIDFESVNAIDPECVRCIAKVFPTTPIIIMGRSYQARGVRSNMSEWYSEFIQKPFDFKELEICVRKHDAHIFPIKSSLVSLGHTHTYDTHSQTLFQNKEQLALTNKERILISLFIFNKNKPLPQEDISYALYNNPYAESSAIRSMVSRLRRKLDGRFIKSYRSEGYIWEDEAS